jgi:hypothetical protein
VVPLPEEIVAEAQHFGRVLQSRNGAARHVHHNGSTQVHSVQTL